MQSQPGFPHSLLEYLNRPPGYEQLQQARGLLRPRGENVLERDWDLCVVLDACRADLLEEAIADGWRPPRPFTYETITSLESATEPWIERTVDVEPAVDRRSDAGVDAAVVRDGVEPIAYVCSNPFSVAARGAAVVETLDEVWRYGWDETLRTVPPSVVTDRAVAHVRRSDRRVLVHYLQPHMPAIRRGEGGELERCYPSYGAPEHATAEKWLQKAAGEGSLWRRALENWDSPRAEPTDVFEDLRFGDVDHATFWRWYRECLDVVLEEVETLLRAVDAADVLVTADHGNAVGEWGVYAHPYHVPIDALREVPVLETTACAEIAHEPRTAAATIPVPAESADDRPERDAAATEEGLEERLRALGYR